VDTHLFSHSQLHCLLTVFEGQVTTRVGLFLADLFVSTLTAHGPAYRSFVSLEAKQFKSSNFVLQSCSIYDRPFEFFHMNFRISYKKKPVGIALSQ
jgi:hypothetical protein